MITVLPLVLPILATGAQASPILLLAAVVVFVVGEAIAAIVLADAARRRSSVGGTRLWIAAVATALFGLSILAFGTANATSAAEPSQLVGRLMVVLAALGYLVAFLPPRPLRRRGMPRRRTAACVTCSERRPNRRPPIWRHYLTIVGTASDTTAALVVVPDDAGGDGGIVAMVDGLPEALIGRHVPTTMPGVPGRLRIGDPRQGALGAFIADAVDGSGARYVDVVRLGPDRAPVLLLVAAIAACSPTTT